MMERNTLDGGKIMICTGWVSIFMQIKSDMTGNFYTIRKKDMVYIIGQMEGNMKDGGKQANSTVLEFILMSEVIRMSSNSVSGNKEKGEDGLTKHMC
jgi:hypothetical protein